MRTKYWRTAEVVSILRLLEYARMPVTCFKLIEEKTQQKGKMTNQVGWFTVVTSRIYTEILYEETKVRIQRRRHDKNKRMPPTNSLQSRFDGTERKSNVFIMITNQNKLLRSEYLPVRLHQMPTFNVSLRPMDQHNISPLQGSIG
jgi:hypothetical protein